MWLKIHHSVVDFQPLGGGFSAIDRIIFRHVQAFSTPKALGGARRYESGTKRGLTEISDS